MFMEIKWGFVAFLTFLINCCCFTAVNSEFIGLLQDLLNVNFSKVNISAECESGLVLLKNDLENREIWALKALDSSGYLTGDFVWGNNMSPGSPRSCDYLTNPKEVFLGSNFVPKSYENITQIQSPIPLNYRVLHARHHSRMQFDIQFVEKNVVDMAFCMPATCDDTDSERLFQTMLNSERFLNRTIFENGLDLIRTKVLQLTNEFYSNRFVQAFFAILIILVSLICLEMVLRTVRNCFMYYNKSLDSIHEEKSKRNVFEKFLSCFSASENVSKIFNTDVKEANIPVLDGLKAISMFFFIVGHVGVFGISAFKNFQHIYPLARSPFIQPLFAMHFLVDSFFVISGTLVAYHFFEFTKTNKIKSKLIAFIKMAIRRYLRLTPPYLAHILFVITATKVIQDMSAFYLMEDNVAKCSNTWWKNMLYISNYEIPEETCLLWSYYLADDFQLYLIVAILMLIFVKSKKVGSALFFIVLLVSIITCGFYGYTMHYVPTFYTAKQTSQYLYTPVWSRVPPYFVGVFCGWFLSKNERTLKMNQFLVGICWALTGAIFAYLQLSGMEPKFSPMKSLFYTAFSRFGWGIAVGWVIVACVTNHGGFIQKILSMQFFIPFSRLTYAAYLTNPIWILLTTMLAESPVHVDYAMLPVNTTGFVICVYTAALVFCVIFESPFIRLYKLLGI